MQSFSPQGRRLGRFWSGPIKSDDPILGVRQGSDLESPARSPLQPNRV